MREFIQDAKPQILNGHNNAAASSLTACLLGSLGEEDDGSSYSTNAGKEVRSCQPIGS
jgi:hypothetical protein